MQVNPDSHVVHPFQSFPPHWSQCFCLQPPPGLPGVLLGLGLDVRVDEGRGVVEGRSVVEGLCVVEGLGVEEGVSVVGGSESVGVGIEVEGVTIEVEGVGTEVEDEDLMVEDLRVVLGLGGHGGRDDGRTDGRGGLAPPFVGVSTREPSQYMVAPFSCISLRIVLIPFVPGPLQNCVFAWLGFRGVGYSIWKTGLFAARNLS